MSCSCLLAPHRRTSSIRLLVARLLCVASALYGTAFVQAQTFTVLHAYTGGNDGGYPVGGLLVDGSGNLYGTTSAGGTADLGTVFKLDSGGKETVLHNFRGGTDGSLPQAGLVVDRDGDLFGTTYRGGDPNCDPLFGG